MKSKIKRVTVEMSGREARRIMKTIDKLLSLETSEGVSNRVIITQKEECSLSNLNESLKRIIKEEK